MFPPAHESETLLRFRGNLVCSLDSAQSPGVLVQVAVGFLVVPEGSGTTVSSLPGTNPDSPWFWYEIFTVGYEEMVTDVVDVAGLSIYRSVIDSKAMRIVRNQEIQMVTQNTTVGSASGINLVVGGRILSGT